MNGQVGKKAVHVKWAGKTIALGTFPMAEADDKCARAKALTRAWRSTMRPKPSREWVMLELERLNVRVVSGRLGNKDNGSDGSEDDDDSRTKRDNSNLHNMMDPSLMGARRGSITASLLNAADMVRSDWGGDRMSFGLDNSFVPMRRNSSLPMSLLGGDTKDMPNLGGGNKDVDPAIPPRRPLVGGGSAAAYEAARADHYRKLAEQKNSKPSNNSTHSTPNPSSGRMSSSSNNSKNGSQRHMSDLQSSLGLTSSLGMSGFNAGSSMGQMRDNNSGNFSAINPNEHYEMLKLHHMNLLNEIQETTLMMNLYQQQQMQQENLQKQLQMQLQQEQKRQRQQQEEDQHANGFDTNMLLAHQGNSRIGGGDIGDVAGRSMNGKGNMGVSGYDSVTRQPQSDYENGGNERSSSRGNGEAPPIDSVTQISHESDLDRDGVSRGVRSEVSGGPSKSNTVSKGDNHGSEDNKPVPTSDPKQTNEPESELDRKKRELQKIKDEIAERQRMLEELERAEGRKEETIPNDDESNHSHNIRPKLENGIPVTSTAI